MTISLHKKLLGFFSIFVANIKNQNHKHLWKNAIRNNKSTLLEDMIRLSDFSEVQLRKHSYQSLFKGLISGKKEQFWSKLLLCLEFQDLLNLL